MEHDPKSLILKGTGAELERSGSAAPGPVRPQTGGIPPAPTAVVKAAALSSQVPPPLNGSLPVSMTGRLPDGPPVVILSNADLEPLHPHSSPGDGSDPADDYDPDYAGDVHTVTDDDDPDHSPVPADGPEDEQGTDLPDAAAGGDLEPAPPPAPESAQDPDPAVPDALPPLVGNRPGRPRGKRFVPSAATQAAPPTPPAEAPPILNHPPLPLPTATQMNPQQKLLILDTWQRSGLPASDFSRMVGVSKHTLYLWKQRFDAFGPEGLMNKPKGGPKGSRLLEVTKRTILMIKRTNPDYGCERISAMLTRGPALQASASAVATVLKEAGYVTQEEPTHPHPDKPRSFERARPNQMWQTDLFTFMLKRQNRRVFLIVYLDDHSRFIVGYGLHASASTELAIDVFRSGVASYGAPEEVLTDNGPQYHTWRGKSKFTKAMEQIGVKQIVAKPRHPQTLGKTERFWGTLWRELLDRSIFLDMGDAKIRIGHFIDHYNFQRPHQGIDNLVPADRFFQAAPEVLKTLKARVAANALDLSQGGVPKQPFYMTGQVGGQGFSLHAEGERMILTSEAGVRKEVDLTRPTQPLPAPTPVPVCPDGSPPGAVLPEQPPPGVSVLDAGIRQLQAQVPAQKETGHAEDQAR